MISAIYEVIFLIYALIQFFKDDNDDINSNDRKKLFRETSVKYFKGNLIKFMNKFFQDDGYIILLYKIWRKSS